MRFESWQPQEIGNSGRRNDDARRVAGADARKRIGFLLVVLCAFACLDGKSRAQTVPFEVSNPKHLSWSVEEAGRIYESACQLVARSVRSAQPSQLQPKFVLVLGAKADQMVRGAAMPEIHLRRWDPARFAEVMVLLTLRDAVKNADVIRLARQALDAAEATVSVNELRQQKIEGGEENCK